MITFELPSYHLSLFAKLMGIIYVRQKNERTNESTNENHERAIEFK
jgi:hypothetical protein